MKKFGWVILGLAVIVLIVVLATDSSEPQVDPVDPGTETSSSTEPTDETSDNAPAGIMAENTISAVDQAVDADGTVTVASVNLSPMSEMNAEMAQGFVVVHRANAQGNPVVPQSIGHAMIEQGMSSNVEVQLDEDVAAGDQLFVMLHRDTNGNGEYEFGEGSTDVDTPVEQNGEIVVDSFTVTE